LGHKYTEASATPASGILKFPGIILERHTARMRFEF
jgi:hypothetical protein